MTSRMDETTQGDETRLYQLVVVGSSAGGVEALSTLVAALPANFPAPIVLAQHLDPTHPSHLGEILARHATLPVRTVTNHEPLLPGVVYVVPADRHVEITEHAVHLRTNSETTRRRPKPSIDRLLTTAARVYGERLIAVILTGTGSDGTLGARAVKAAGGLVLIENPVTAAYPGMPESLAPSTVDLVADLARIGPLLVDLLTTPFPIYPSALNTTNTTPAPTDAQQEERSFQALLALVRERSGIDFGRYKRPTILRRLQRRLVAVGLRQLPDYLHYLSRHPEEYARLVASFLINVTEFFRDPALFAVLRDEVLPDLIVHARTQRNELRIWSAGCATGEEAYSLAILVAEALGEDLDQFTVQIFATDLDEEAVAFARRGLYPAVSLAGVSQELRARYFTLLDRKLPRTSDGRLENSQPDRNADLYEVTPYLRSLVIFGEHDLGQRAPFPRIDLVLCRNVLMYFTPELQKRTLQLFAFALRDGGYLALGKAETAKPLGAYFVAAHQHLKLYHRHGERVLAPIARTMARAGYVPLSLTSAQPNALPANGHLRSPVAAPRGALVPPELLTYVAPTSSPGTRDTYSRVSGVTGGMHTRSSSESLGNLLLDAEVGVVVVDQEYDIHIINSAARRLLGIYRVAVGNDLIHLAQHVPPTVLRQVIDAAFLLPGPGSALEFTSAQESESDRALGLESEDAGTAVTLETVQGEVRDLQISCYPQRQRQQLKPDLDGLPTTGTTATARVEQVLVLVSDVTRLVGKQRAAFTAFAREEGERQRAQTREPGDLERAYLTKIAELERLQAQIVTVSLDNRALVKANQELVEANLRLRTANDELLVGREEAEASAEEIKTLNEELQATNEELVTVNEELEATVEELHTANEDLDRHSRERQRLAAPLK
jgi:two-component system, chemotaxis family, CheB/CheR fusion protein